MLKRPVTFLFLASVLAPGASANAQKPTIVRELSAGSRATFARATSLAELWKNSDLVAEVIVEAQRPANHMSGSDEQAFTMYRLAVNEIFKAPPEQLGTPLYVRRSGGTIERENVIERLQITDDMDVSVGDRLIVFLRRFEAQLPPPNDHPYYVGTTLSEPTSFAKIVEGQLTIKGRTGAAEMMRQLTVTALKGELRRLGDR